MFYYYNDAWYLGEYSANTAKAKILSCSGKELENFIIDDYSIMYSQAFPVIAFMKDKKLIMETNLPFIIKIDYPDCCTQIREVYDKTKFYANLVNFNGDIVESFEYYADYYSYGIDNYYLCSENISIHTNIQSIKRLKD